MKQFNENYMMKILTIDNMISPILKFWKGQGHDLVNWRDEKAHS